MDVSNAGHASGRASARIKHHLREGACRRGALVVGLNADCGGLPRAYVPTGLHGSPEAVELNASSIRKRTQIQQALKLWLREWHRGGTNID
jgi:hypothetical protein